MRGTREREEPAGAVCVAGDLTDDEYPLVSADGSPELTGSRVLVAGGRGELGEECFCLFCLFQKMLICAVSCLFHKKILKHEKNMKLLV
jgi:hypothetical protein